MKIIEITENKKQYLDLLLLADEQENMIAHLQYHFMKSVVLSVRMSFQIFLQITMTIQYTKMEYNWWIWYIGKESYKEK